MTRSDNSTLDRKVRLRRAALAELTEPPVILDAYGGKGHIYLACYTRCLSGVVIERDQHKSDILARQRPTWRVYQGDSPDLIAGGAGSDLQVNVIDVDPRGDPWPVITAFFAGERERSATLHVLVNDGMRRKVQISGAWISSSLRTVVHRRGNDLYACYLDVCRDLLAEKAQAAGYTLTAWAGYYTGHNDQMTHYRAVLRR